MADWYDTKTHEHLKEAIAGGSEAGRRYLYFARQGDVEGYPGVAARFRAVAEGARGHGWGRFAVLAEVGDAVIGGGWVPRRTTLRPLSPARHTTTPRCVRASRTTAGDDGFAEIVGRLGSIGR